jgi:uncharacterized protein
MSQKERYERAVESLCEKLKQDRAVIAVILSGSLAYDAVWEKSDIDLTILVDESVKPDSLTLTEDEISIHANVMRRSDFKKNVDSAMMGSFINSFLYRSKILFTKDDSLKLFWENVGPIGERDKKSQYLRRSAMCLPTLTKVEKWLKVKKDPHYAAYYILYVTMQLAFIEIIAAGENPGREVIQQALKLNPKFFHKVYTDVLDGPKTLDAMTEAWQAQENYLAERIELCFAPLLEYLSEADGPRSTRELNAYFAQHWHAEAMDLVCDWLADRGIVGRTGISVRLTKNSRVSVEEAGYYRSTLQ